MSVRTRHLTVACAALLLASAAHAKVYPTTLDVDDEADLRRLVADGILADDEYETLADLLSAPIDLNYATSNQLFDLPGLSLGLCRDIVADRRKNGPFDELEDLLRVDGFDEGLLEQLRPFAIAGAKVQLAKAPIGGFLRTRITYNAIPAAPLNNPHPNRAHSARQLGYNTLPRGYALAKVDYGRWLEAGFLGVLDEGVYKPQLSPETGQIHAQWGRPVLDFGKAYLRVQRGNFRAMIGSYTAGFGLGTVFDRTTRDRPDGFYEDLIVQGVEGEFRVRRGQLGFAASMIDQPVGKMRLSATLFGSMSPMDVYQNDLAYMTDFAGSPYEGAAGPRLYVPDKDGTFTRLQFETVPNVAREDQIGGNITLGVSNRTDVGATAYAAQARVRTAVAGSAEDRFRLRLRNGYDANTYGAAGLFVSTGIGPVDATVEYGRSFDGSDDDGRGGNALQGQVILSQKWGTVEGSVRYYETGYDNPNASGSANPDEFHGQRDRDEVGGRIETQVFPTDWLTLRAYGDMWRNLRLRRDNYELYARADVTPLPGWRISALANSRNRDIRNNGRTRIYGGDYEDIYVLSETGGTTLPTDDSDFVDGAGTRTFWGLETRVDVIPLTRLTFYYQRMYEDIGRLYPDSGNPCKPWYMIGHYGWVRADVTPIEGTTLSARVRYRDDDIFGSRDQEFLDAFLQLRQKLPHNITLQVRGALVSNLPDAQYEYGDVCDPERTAADPYPELDETIYFPVGLSGWAWVNLEWRF